MKKICENMCKHRVYARGKFICVKYNKPLQVIYDLTFGQSRLPAVTKDTNTQRLSECKS